MRALILGLVVALTGCPIAPKPTPPSAGATADFGYADCPVGTKTPVTSEVCGTLQTSAGLRCVACGVTSDCVYREAVVLCVASCIDPACK